MVVSGYREIHCISGGRVEQIRDKVVEASLIEVAELTLSIGASVGAAYNAELEGGWQGLVGRADAKAYEAKAAGRGRRILADFSVATT
jgi:GGDEF domain-containing protein